jgi:hypothetical protein
MTWGPPGRALPDRPLARRLPSRVHDATNFIADAGGTPAPQLILVSLCLADECHRPNCQRAAQPIRSIAPAGLVPMRGCSLARRRADRLTPPTSTDTIGRCRLPQGNSLRPSSRSLGLLARQQQYYLKKHDGQLPTPIFSEKGWPAIRSIPQIIGLQPVTSREFRDWLESLGGRRR